MRSTQLNRSLDSPPRSQMLARLVALVVALALQTVAGQELYITTATSGNGPNSNQYLGIQLVDSAGNLKAQATLGPFQTKGGLTTWNANGVGFAFGDELRFKWTTLISGVSAACRSVASCWRAKPPRSGWTPIDVTPAVSKSLAVGGRFSGAPASATPSWSATFKGPHVQLDWHGRCKTRRRRRRARPSGRPGARPSG